MTLAVLAADPDILAGQMARADGSPEPDAVRAAATWLHEMREAQTCRLVRVLPTSATGLAELRKDNRLGGPWYRDATAAQRATAREHRGLLLTLEAHVAVDAIDWPASLSARLDAGHAITLIPGTRVRIASVDYGRAGQRRYPCRPGLIGRAMTI